MKKRVLLTLLYCIVLLLSNSAFAVNSKPIPSREQPTIEIIQKQLSVDDLVLAVYLFFKKDKKNAHISAWIGFGVRIVIVLLLLAAFLYFIDLLAEGP